jgi:hypothetical protein
MKDVFYAFIAWLVTRNISVSEIVLNLILIVLGYVLIRALWKIHRSNGNGNPLYRNFNLVHLIVNKDGYPDGAKCIEIGAFIILSWGFIAYVTSGKLAEWYMQFYIGVFVMRGAYGAYLRSKSEPDVPGTTVKTEAVTTVKTTEVKPEPPMEVIPDQPKGDKS